MPIYEYETIPTHPDEKSRRVEFRQNMTEPVLTHHPETGEAIRRVYSAFHVGGGVSTSNYASAPSQSAGHGSGCACCRPDGMCGMNG